MPALSPPDAEVALRSLPRRFREAIASAAAGDEDRVDDLTSRPGPDGKSVVDHVTETTGLLTTLDRALESVLVAEEAVLHPGVLDSENRDYSSKFAGAPLSLGDALLDLELTAMAFADRVRRAHASEWVREARVAGRVEGVQAIEILRQAVRESLERLAVVPATIAHVKRV